MSWPADWQARKVGLGCPMCAAGRPEETPEGVRIAAGSCTDAYLQRADVQRGYTLVIWRGRHVSEPFELSPNEASRYWLETLQVARALEEHYKPVKVNYETLGNVVPHLHTHLLPRYWDDAAPGRPFPLPVLDGTEAKIPEAQLDADVRALRVLLAPAG